MAGRGKAMRSSPTSIFRYQDFREMVLLSNPRKLSEKLGLKFRLHTQPHPLPQPRMHKPQLPRM
jgi:hypothetical protein